MPLTVRQAILPAAAFPGGFFGHVRVIAPRASRLKPAAARIGARIGCPTKRAGLRPQYTSWLPCRARGIRLSRIDRRGLGVPRQIADRASLSAYHGWKPKAPETNGTRRALIKSSVGVRIVTAGCDGFGGGPRHLLDRSEERRVGEE